jgi:hypothetical protein
MKAVGSAMQSIEQQDNLSLSLKPASDIKQSVQLPAICYPTTPLFLDSSQQQQQIRSRTPFNLQGLQYRTTTFTQFQTTTFRYPPTPPIDIDNMMSSHDSQSLSHMNYGGLGDNSPATTADKSAFASLPTPPDLVPISELDSTSTCSLSPQTCSKNSYYPLKQQWQHMQESADLTNSHCLSAQQSINPWISGPAAAQDPSTPPSTAIIPSGIHPSSHPHLFFQLPQYGDAGMIF